MDEEAGMEHREQVDRLEREADKMAQESERLGGTVEDARGDWEAKEGDVSVPGAQPAFDKALEDDDKDEGEEPDAETTGGEEEE